MQRPPTPADAKLEATVQQVVEAVTGAVAPWVALPSKSWLRAAALRGVGLADGELSPAQAARAEVCRSLWKSYGLIVGPAG